MAYEHLAPAKDKNGFLITQLQWDNLQAKLEASREVNKILRTDADQNCTRAAAAESRLAKMRYVLENLYALVKGECPSLLEDDHHDDMVRDAIAPETAAPQEQLVKSPVDSLMASTQQGAPRGATVRDVPAPAAAPCAEIETASLSDAFQKAIGAFQNQSCVRTQQEALPLIHRAGEIIKGYERDLTRLRTGIQTIAKRIRNEGMQGVANELEELLEGKS